MASARATQVGAEARRGAADLHRRVEKHHRELEAAQLCVQRLPAGATEERLAGRYCGGSWCAAVPAEAIGSVLVTRESKLPGPEKNLLIDRPRPCACGRKDGTDDAGPRQSPARRRRRAWSTSTRSSSTITRASSRATARGAGS